MTKQKKIEAGDTKNMETDQTDSNPPFTAAGRKLLHARHTTGEIISGLKAEREYAFEQWLKEASGTTDGHRYLTRSETLREVIKILEFSDGKIEPNSEWPCGPIPEWMFGTSVEARNALQNCGRVHPYTCGNNECRKTTNQAPLRAVEGGWICDHCGYTQQLNPQKEPNENR